MTPAGLRILVVEDDVAEAVSLSDVLKGMGHVPLGPAHCAEEAVSMALEMSPDLILMDIRLPNKDGLWAAREILSHRTVGLIFITGYDSNDTLAAACEAGGLAYMLKPIGARQLETALEVAWARLGDIRGLRSQVAGLEEALTLRKQVEKAKGILMEKLGLSEDEAYRRLQKQARDTNQKLSQVAAAVIAAAGTLWGRETKPTRKHD